MSKAAELAALIGSQTALSNRNLIINGAMNVSQRATSSTGVGASSGYFTVDRFALAFSGTAGRLTMTQTAVTDLPGFTKCIKLDCTTADTSIAAGEFFLLQYKFEGQDLQRLKNATSQAESFTVSFYVKGNAAATYTLEAKDIKNTRNNSQNFSVTTSWNRVSLTFVGDTDTNQSAFDHDNSNEFSLQFWLHAGSTYNGGTFASNTWIDQVQNLRANSNDTSFFDSTDRTLEITGLQMEIGEVATPFEHRSIADDLAACQRYYQKSYSPGVFPGATSGSGIGASIMYRAYGTGQLRFSGQFKQSFRDVPTVTAYSPYSGNSAHCSENSSTTDKNIGGAQASTELFYAPMTEDCVDGRTYEIAFEAESEL